MWRNLDAEMILCDICWMIRSYFPPRASDPDCDEVDVVPVFETEVLDLNTRHETHGKAF